VYRLIVFRLIVDNDSTYIDTYIDIEYLIVDIARPWLHGSDTTTYQARPSPVATGLGDRTLNCGLILVAR